MPTPSSVPNRYPLHLRAGGVSVVLDSVDAAMPSVLHWGRDLGDLDDRALASMRLAAEPEVAANTVDEVRAVGVVAEHWTGWPGAPGLRGSRQGADWSARFTIDGVDVQSADSGATRVLTSMSDAVAGLSMTLEVELTGGGLLRLRATVCNDGGEPYALDGFELAVPVPARGSELLDFTGRHARERSPQRQPFSMGTHVRDSRRGRTGTDATLLMVAGERGFGFRGGEVWGVHVAWSGNHRSFAERVPLGIARLGGGELLLPGEVVLGRGEAYTTPWLYASYGTGLDEMSARYHSFARSQPGRRRTLRPVVLNTWEAVYFDHDLQGLTELATLGAEVGVERFVLDDGWFRGRRDDTAGLGDWEVDPDVWPQGLHPLVEHVRSLGLQFGLWVEPEMVNLDSDLARAHPDWILRTGARLPVEARGQQVLDLGNPDAWAHMLARLDSLLVEYPIEYLKWDHNRDLVDAGSGARGAPGVRQQTLAVYRLLDELRRRHPDIEIETCSSGGGRIDLEILERTDRVWTSDCIDPLERQAIQRWTGLLIPPELLGAHVGGPRSHTTGRVHDLSFRAGSALLGHYGVEWDLRTADEEALKELAQWIALHKEIRDLLSEGSVVRSDSPDTALWVHGVVAADRTHAVYALVAMATGVHAPPGPVQLPGLDERRTYRVEPLPPGDAVRGPRHGPPPWWEHGVTLPGVVLSTVGVQAPTLDPEHLVLLDVRAVDA